MNATDPSTQCLRYRRGEVFPLKDRHLTAVLRACVDSDLKTMRDLKQSKYGDSIPFGLFPDLPGLFPWGCDVNGDTFFWLINDSVELWPIVMWPEGGDGGDFEQFEVPLTTFLAGLLTRQIVPRVWQGTEFFVEQSSLSFQSVE